MFLIPLFIAIIIIICAINCKKPKKQVKNKTYTYGFTNNYAEYEASLSSYAQYMRSLDWDEINKPKHNGTAEGIMNQFIEDIQDDFT